MSSFFPFSSSSTSLSNTHHASDDDPRLEISITPSASAFYAGETFSATIRFRNTRTPPFNALRSHVPAQSALAFGPDGARAASLPYRDEVPTPASSARLLPAPSLDKHAERTGVSASAPRRRSQIGLRIPPRKLNHAIYVDGDAEAGPSRAFASPLTMSGSSTPLVPSFEPGSRPGYPCSPGANSVPRAPGFRGPSSPERGELMYVRSPEEWRRSQEGGTGVGRGRRPGHGRKSQSLSLGQAGMSPQEMVWALGGQPTPPALPTRRPGTASIPYSHPHSRKISVSSTVASPPPTDMPLPPFDLPSIPESSSVPSLSAAQQSPRWPDHSLLPPSRQSDASLDSAARSVIDLTDDDSRTSSEWHHDTSHDRNHDAVARPPVPPVSPARPPTSPLSSSRAPSYANAYGAAFLNPAGSISSGSSSPVLPPPSHPYLRGRTTEPRGTTTILWAYARLVAHFHPANAYIPPDPLLPLRSLLLHQPVGSGSLSTSSSFSESSGAGGAVGMKTSPSRWQMSFGTGTIGGSKTPSFTGSLFGLAKDLVSGGQGGSLEEERKRVWNMKDLPVFETGRSLLGVDMKFKEGEEREFTYTIQLPNVLPPAHRGKAFRFSYDLVVSLTVTLPGAGRRQRSKNIQIPIRVWANVSLAHPIRTYDVLNPIIQTKDEADVQETHAPPDGGQMGMTRSKSTSDTRLKSGSGDTQDSLEAYAKHLLENLDLPARGEKGKPLSRVTPASPSKPLRRSRVSSPSAPAGGLPQRNGSPPSPRAEGAKVKLDVPNGIGEAGPEAGNGVTKGFRPRRGSFVKGDDELVKEVQEAGGCGEAVEILSRHSAKSSYDIAKDGDLVAVLTLIKTSFRLGETILGVVTFNGAESDRRVLKFSAFLESHERIPENLLPISASSGGRSRQPPLARLHAEHRSAYAVHTTRLAFSLDIPSDGTPAFALAAGPDGAAGGLEWRVRLAFLVSVPSRRARRSMSAARERGKSHHGGKDGDNPGPGHIAHGAGLNVVPVPTGGGKDPDNRYWRAGEGLAPVLPVETRGGASGGQHSKEVFVSWEEARVEMVECEVPVRVLAGNTAFVVRPSVFVV